MRNVGLVPPHKTTRYDLQMAGLGYLLVRDRSGADLGWLVIGRTGDDSGQVRGFLRWHHGRRFTRDDIREEMEFVRERLFFRRTEHVVPVDEVVALISG
jgi:hypothetical protein